MNRGTIVRNDIIYSGEKDKVSYVPTLSEGTEIGTLTINGEDNVLYAPAGGGGGGSSVEVSAEYTEGTKIATIAVDGIDNDIYIPDSQTSNDSMQFKGYIDCSIETSDLPNSGENNKGYMYIVSKDGEYNNISDNVWCYICKNKEPLIFSEDGTYKVRNANWPTVYFAFFKNTSNNTINLIAVDTNANGPWSYDWNQAFGGGWSSAYANKNLLCTIGEQKYYYDNNHPTGLPIDNFILHTFDSEEDAKNYTITFLNSSLKKYYNKDDLALCDGNTWVRIKTDREPDTVKLSTEGYTDKSIRFGITEDGQYGYYKVGADTVTPFKTGGGEDYTELINSINEKTHIEDTNIISAVNHLLAISPWSKSLSDTFGTLTFKQKKFNLVGTLSDNVSVELEDVEEATE